MSKKSNVNPDHYKLAGRERPGHDIAQEVQKQNYAATAQKLDATRNQFDPMPATNPVPGATGKPGERVRSGGSTSAKTRKAARSRG